MIMIRGLKIFMISCKISQKEYGAQTQDPNIRLSKKVMANISNQACL